jgi:hypothetical protein
MCGLSLWVSIKAHFQHQTSYFKQQPHIEGF